MNHQIHSKKKQKKKYYIVLYLIFAAMFLAALYQLGTYYLDYYKAKQGAEDLADQVVVWESQENEPGTKESEPTIKDDKTKQKTIIPESIDFEKLWEENKEIVAWLYCPDTVISYPVMHTTDNEKYLRKNLALEYSNEGNLFIETANRSDFSDWNTIIYGHNMKNGSMFKTITYYEDDNYYIDHPVMYLYTPEHRYEIRLLAGCVVDAAESELYQVGIGTEASTDEKKALLNKLMKKSTFASDEKTDEYATYVTLSTCSYEYESARYILTGKLIEW